jgi:hypothetical protein
MKQILSPRTVEFNVPVIYPAKEIRDLAFLVVSCRADIRLL